MEKILLKLRTLTHFSGELPKYETALSSGFDIRAQIDQSIVLNPGDRALLPTGLSFEIPEGYELQARPRSGLAIRKGLSLVNAPGTIDADYRGEIKIIIINHGNEAVQIQDQDRIAQLVLCPIVQAKFVQVDKINATQRGTGGFGSTGAH